LYYLAATDNLKEIGVIINEWVKRNSWPRIRFW
jgi:hypothetical protein